MKLKDDKVLKWVEKQQQELVTPYKNEILDSVMDSKVGLKGSEGWWRKVMSDREDGDEEEKERNEAPRRDASFYPPSAYPH